MAHILFIVLHLLGAVVELLHLQKTSI